MQRRRRIKIFSKNLKMSLVPPPSQTKQMVSLDNYKIIRDKSTSKWFSSLKVRLLQGSQPSKLFNQLSKLFNQFSKLFNLFSLSILFNMFKIIHNPPNQLDSLINLFKTILRILSNSSLFNRLLYSHSKLHSSHSRHLIHKI